MIDLEEWFAHARRAADYFGMRVAVVEGQLVMICDDEVHRVKFDHEVAL